MDTFFFSLFERGVLVLFRMWPGVPLVDSGSPPDETHVSCGHGVLRSKYFKVIVCYIFND